MGKCWMMRVFFLVFARDQKYVAEKIEELDRLGFSYLIVCGEKYRHSKVVYRKPKGKYDAINFGFEFVPTDTEIVAMNDVDTKIRNFGSALRCFDSEEVDLVFAKVVATEGPQQLFLPMLRRLRRIMTVAASGDLMLVKYEALKRALPVKPCKAEDSYVLFRVLTHGGKAADCEECYVLTDKTRSVREEQQYKERTVLGIYQALALANPPSRIKFFYAVLPIISPVLLVSGKNGLAWARGILKGVVKYLQYDRSGYWQPINNELR
jgi:cellulose synthase/poly-beta-1,6-N-acetylglucosamine synthase-like glycosyltransferase